MMKDAVTRERRTEKEKEKEKEKRALGAYISTLQSKRAWDALVHGNMA